MRTTKKTFDCVEMKRRGAEVVQQEIAGMTIEEELEYWSTRTKELMEHQTAVRAAAKVRESHGKKAA